MMSARSSAARCGAPARSSRITRCRSSSPPICRCWSSTPCCSSRCCSTCSTTPPNMRPPAPRSRSGVRGTGIRSSLQIIDEGDGIPPAELEQRVRQILPGAEGRSCPARHRAWPCDLARLCRGDARHDYGRNRTDRSGAVLTIRLPVPATANGWIPPHERRPDQGPGHRRRAADPQAAADGPEHAGLRHSRSLQRQDRAGTARRGARPDHPRSRPARHPGPRIAAHDPRPQRERADRGAVEPRRRGRQGAGARPRRRRLRDQAVRHG